MVDRRIISLSLTLVLITLLYFSGPGSAILVHITTDKADYGTSDTIVTFTLGVDVDIDERIPVENLTLNIIGPTNLTCVFNPAGTNLTSCPNILSITVINAQNYSSGARWGYDEGAGTNHSFTTGFGYAYTYGYAYTSSVGSELYYNITWNITAVTEGTYTATLIAAVSDGATTHDYNSSAISFSILTGTTASFNGNFYDAVDDADNNTLYDYLIVTVGVNASVNGTYKITGRLDAPKNGGYVETWPISWVVNNTALYEGENNVTLMFQGQDINRRAIDGPYILKYLRVYDSAWALLDVRDNSYNTTDYNYTQFEREIGQFTDSSGWADAGVDTNSNGKYDYLAITAGVNITNAGTYRVEGVITEVGTGLGVHAINRTYLANGTNNVTLYFDGLELASKGLDGPYLLWVVRLVDISKATWVTLDKEANYYITNTYNSTDFETPTASFTGNYWDTGSDDNNNSLYDYLNVTAEVNVSRNGTYIVRGRLVRVPVGHVKWKKARLNLTSGLNNVTLQYDGMLLNNLGYNGNYTLRRLLLVEVTNNVWIPLDDRFEAYQTSPYNSTEFESPAATLSGPYGDVGVDTDSDLDYNYIGFTTGVNVTTDGFYVVRAELVDPSQTPYLWGFKRHIMWAKNLTNLTAGYNNVTLYFDGQRIRSGGWSGNFAIRHLILLSVTGNLTEHVIDEITPIDAKYYVHTTQNYSTSDFDAPAATFSGTYSDYGTDLNSNGKFDYLSIDVGLDVNTEDYYLLAGTLADVGGTYAQTALNRRYLYASTTNVTLNFDGMLIANTGTDGFYRLNSATLWILPDNNLSNSTLLYGLIGPYVSANTFTTSQFETPFVSLSGNYSDYGVDLNSNSLYDKLIVNVSVEVRETGLYMFDGLLRTQNKERTFGAINMSVLTTGNYTIPLAFHGRKIRQVGINGPYSLRRVRALRWNATQSSWRLLDLKFDIYTTQAYNYTQFET